MRWLELIHLRPTASRNQALAHLATMRPDLESAPNLVEAHVYAQAGLGADVAIHLAWAGDHAPVRTRLGLAIADSLRGFGLVDHSIWREDTP